MVVFSDPRWLIGLLALPILLLFEWRAARRAARGLLHLVGRRAEVLLEQHRPRERAVRATLCLTAVALLLIGAAQPEWGREMVRRAATGSDVVMVVDVSASMDARDVAPSRLAEARREALAVLDRLGGSRVGVVAFAGDAVRLCPLTLDRAAVRMILSSLSSTTLSHPGTDIGRALRRALRMMPGGRREEQAIVLWSDGEDLEQDARAAIDEVARSGAKVFAVGVGTAGGDVVPMVDSEGHVTDVKRDEHGNLVRSRLDEALLRSLARRTRGAYFAADRPGGELPRLLSALAGLARAGRGERMLERPVARFPLFAAVAALVLVVDRARARRRRVAHRRVTLFHTTKRAAAALILYVALPATAQSQSHWAQADRAFRAGRYAEAESLYALRLKGGGPAGVQLNRATAGALAAGDEEADRELGRLAARRDRIGLEAGYNLGTHLGQSSRYDPALRALRTVIERDPEDEDARWNYELLSRRRKEEPRPDPDRPNPRPSGAGGGNGGEGGGTASPPPPPASGGSPPTPAPRAPEVSRAGEGRMSRDQAERLLSVLQELARAEQQRGRAVRVLREKRGKDW